jgi:hypothetical protein
MQAVACEGIYLKAPEAMILVLYYSEFGDVVHST